MWHHLFSSLNHCSSLPSYTGLASLYPLGVEPLYTWAYDSAQLCANTPACLACPALLQCDWMLLEVSATTPPPLSSTSSSPRTAASATVSPPGARASARPPTAGGPSVTLTGARQRSVLYIKTAESALS